MFHDEQGNYTVIVAFQRNAFDDAESGCKTPVVDAKSAKIQLAGELQDAYNESHAIAGFFQTLDVLPGHQPPVGHDPDVPQEATV